MMPKKAFCLKQNMADGLSGRRRVAKSGSLENAKRKAPMWDPFTVYSSGQIETFSLTILAQCGSIWL